MGFRILEGDALTVLSGLPAESVHCCVTSPPYWGLRDYGTATWEAGDPGCDHDETLTGSQKAVQGYQQGRLVRGICTKCGAVRIDAQLGLEATPEEYVGRIVEVFREVRRVLRDDGTLWLVLGDSYANDGKWGGETSGKQAYLSDNDRRRCGREKRRTGLKPKNLIGIPWRVAFALQADGWYLRQDIIWHKPNPMPESVTDRCTSSHEYVFMLSKSAKYWYDAAAIKEPQVYGNHARNVDCRPKASGQKEHTGLRMTGLDKQRGHSRRHAGFDGRWDRMTKEEQQSEGRNKRDVWTVATHPFPEAHFATYPPRLIEPCILAGCPDGGVVLDPFSGSGTTGVVALRHGRRYLGIELSPEFAEMGRRRILGDAPLLNVEG